MTRPIRRSPVIAAVAASALVLGFVATRLAPPDGQPAGSPTGSAAAAATGIVAPSALLGAGSAVEWRQLQAPFTLGVEPGHDRIDGLIPGGPGLVGWGRIAAPGRNQFNDEAAVYQSIDGSQWRQTPLVAGVGPQDTAEVRFVVDGPAGLLAIGGTCCEDERAAMWRSADGFAWQRIPYPDAFGRNEIWTIAGNAGAYVAGGTMNGDAALWVSRDGLDWRPIDRTAADLGAGLVADIEAVGTGFVAVGQRGVAALDGAMWASADGTTWSRIAAVPPFTGELDVTLTQVVPTADGFIVSGVEGPTAERLRCQAAEAIHLAGTVSPIPPPRRATDLICGWGSDVRWLGRGDAWREIGGGGAAARPGELIEFGIIRPSGPGLIAVGEGLDDGKQSLWVSADGERFERVPAIGGPERGDSVSGVVQIGDRIVAVGEHWDPDGGMAGQPTVWIGVLH